MHQPPLSLVVEQKDVFVSEKGPCATLNTVCPAKIRLINVVQYYFIDVGPVKFN